MCQDARFGAAADYRLRRIAFLDTSVCIDPWRFVPSAGNRCVAVVLLGYFLFDLDLKMHFRVLCVVPR